MNNIKFNPQDSYLLRVDNSEELYIELRDIFNELVSVAIWSEEGALDSFSAEEIQTKNDIALLEDMCETLDEIIELESASEIESIIIKIQNLLSIESTPDTPSENKDNVFEFSLISDFDCPDDLGPLMSSGIAQIQSVEKPFFITSSLLSPQKSKQSQYERDILHKRLKANFDRWDIYRAGEIFLFLPKKERLSPDNLGLKVEKFEKIENWLDLTNGSGTKPEIEDFIDLFIPRKSIRKKMILHGHGDDECVLIGGLHKQNYSKLLDFLDQSGGEILYVRSCYSGDNAL